MIVTDRLVSSFDDIMDYSFTANFEDQLDRIANGELKLERSFKFLLFSFPR